MATSLGPRMARTAGLFQGLVAVPVLLDMGQIILMQLWDDYWRITLYDFITAIINALLSAGILFIIITQWNTRISAPINLILEAVKSGLATGVWVWLMCDSIWGPSRNLYNPHPRGPRIVRAAISIVCLLFLFYPTLVFAYLEKKNASIGDEEEVGGQDGGAAASESTPLLRE